MVWVPLLARPAVSSMLALLDKPAVAPTSKSAITFDKSYNIGPLQSLVSQFDGTAVVADPVGNSDHV